MKWVFYLFSHLMNARASCCAFLKVRLMFALNRFVYSLKIKVETVSSFTASLTVCMCVYMRICVRVCLSGRTERDPSGSKHPLSSNKQYVHIFAFILLSVVWARILRLARLHAAIHAIFKLLSYTPQLTGECQDSGKLWTNVLAVMQ